MCTYNVSEALFQKGRSECGFDSAYANIIWFAFKHTSIMILIEKPVKKSKPPPKKKTKQTNSENKTITNRQKKITNLLKTRCCEKKSYVIKLLDYTSFRRIDTK